FLRLNRQKQEYRFLDKDGNYRWLYDEENLIFNSENKPIEVLGCWKDITENKLAELALVEHANLMALNAAIGFTLTKGGTLEKTLGHCTENFVKYLDIAFARFWMFNEDENVLGLRASAGFYSNLNGEDSSMAVGKVKIGLIAQERKPHMTNSVIGDPDISDQKWVKQEGIVAFLGFPLIAEDELLGVLAMFSRNIILENTAKAVEMAAKEIALYIKRKNIEDALRESEARFKRIFDSNIISMAFSDADGTFTQANDAALNLIGYTQEEVLAGKINWLQLTPAEYLPFDYLALQELLKTGRCDPYEKELIHKSGKPVPILIGTAPIKEGKLDLLGFAIDLTKQKQTEGQLQEERLLMADKIEEQTRELREAYFQIERASRLKDEFLANMSHELRTPLSAIIGMSEAMLEEVYGNLTAKQQKALNTVKESGYHLLALINDILDISKIESRRSSY
ncbi:MAG: multi-sensor signal transduction histidine kinase, partial [bacterium]